MHIYSWNYKWEGRQTQIGYGRDIVEVKICICSSNEMLKQWKFWKSAKCSDIKLCKVIHNFNKGPSKAPGEARDFGERNSMSAVIRGERNERGRWRSMPTAYFLIFYFIIIIFYCYIIKLYFKVPISATLKATNNKYSIILVPIKIYTASGQDSIQDTPAPSY